MHFELVLGIEQFPNFYWKGREKKGFSSLSLFKKDLDGGGGEMGLVIFF